MTQKNLTGKTWHIEPERQTCGSLKMCSTSKTLDCQSNQMSWLAHLQRTNGENHHAENQLCHLVSVIGIKAED